MSKDPTSKSPGGTRSEPNSPKQQDHERSPFRPENMNAEDNALTDDDDNDQIENNQADPSALSSSIDALSSPSLRSRMTYKTTSLTQAETTNRIPKHMPHDSEREKQPKGVQPKKALVERTEKNASKKSNSWMANHYIRNVLCLLSISLIGIVFLWRSQAQSSTVIQMQEDRFKSFVNDLREIKSKFPNQKDRSWLEIRGGVSDVMNASAKPWTFVLYSNETTTTECLAKLLGEAISKAIQSNGSLTLRPKDMGDVYGDAMDHLRPLIEKKKAVVVHDLLNIDPGAIQAFHSMCDRENPLVKGAVYIITIITRYASSPQRPEVFVENLLTERFINKIHVDKLQPLITRLTDGPIIPVEPGNVPVECTM